MRLDHRMEVCLPSRLAANRYRSGDRRGARSSHRLDQLVIDDEQSAVPGRQQVVRNLIANGQACHSVALTAHTLIDQSPRRSAADLLWSARFRGSVEPSCGSSERATEVPRLSRWLYCESIRRRRNSRGGPQKKKKKREI